MTSSIVVKIYNRSNQVLLKTIVWLRAIHIGLWLGVLGRESLHLLSQKTYNQIPQYYDEEFTLGGLWPWEKRVVQKYFTQCQSLVVAGAGAGREVLALKALGYKVQGFECNIKLVEFADQLFKKKNFPPCIHYSPPDSCVPGMEYFDGIVIGWGVYSFISERRQRISFLQQLRKQVHEKSPVFLSFFLRSEKARHFRVIGKVGNAIRGLCGRGYLEIGDDLNPDYRHHFSKEEIVHELREGGFQVEMYSTEIHGHAVGFAY